jgi:opacity protein-like surface antigen
MTPYSILRPLAVALLVLALNTSTATANDWSGHINGLVGLKTMDSSDWPDINYQFSMGFALDFKEDSWPVSIALDLMDTGSESGDDGIVDRGHTTEIHLGVRKIFRDDSARCRPYVGGGLAFVYAQQEHEVDNIITTTQDDRGTGFWVGAGTYYSVYRGFVLGADVRYSYHEVELFGQELKAGGLHTYITGGVQF